MTKIKMLESYLIVVVVSVAALVLIGVWMGTLLGWVAIPLETSEKVGITMAISTVALVIVTGIYARHTQKMAKEMREQRLDTVRPVIDFKWRDYSDANVNRVAWIAGMEGRVPTELSCKLRNVGFGPAIELYSFKIVGQDNRNHCDFGTLKASGETEDWVALSVSQEGNGGVLEAYYKDIHDNTCKSILEVYPVKGEGLRSKLRVEKVQKE